MLTSYLPDESRVSRPLDDGAWKPASGTIRTQRGFKGRGTHLGHRPKWKRARGSNSGSDVQSGRVLPLNEPAKTGAQRRDRTLVDRLQGGCTAIVLTGLGWSTGIEPVMTRSQRAVFTSSPRPPSNWSAARGSHPDLLFCRQVPALAGSRHELARVAGVAPTLPVLETGVLAAGRHPHTGWQPRDRTGLIPA